MLTEGDIKGIVERVVRGYGALVVGTFGSYAVGTAHEGSDLDLFAIKNAAQLPSVRRHAVNRLLFGLLHPLDVHVFTPEEFEATVGEERSFTWIVARQARIYHWTEAATRLVPSLVARAPQGCLP